jgi:hypothetical protein
VSKPSEKMGLSVQAKKLIERHSRAIDESAEEAARKLSSAASVLSGACGLLNLRARYFGATGEHFSVHEYEGIQVVDALDERLLKGLRSLLQGYLGRARRKPSEAVLALLAEKLQPEAREIPQYPVGYMIHYTLLSSFQTFEPLVEAGHGFEQAELEVAMVHHLLGILEKYVQTREKPVTRHFSDVAREYSVVMRLKCGCGAEKYDVKLQALCQSLGGDPFDRLDLQCHDCGARRSITFDLPHFKDMYQI